MARVFISYKRTEPDTGVAQAVERALTAAGHEVFIDLKMTVGTRWAEEIERRLHWMDLLVSLLSAEAVRSDMTRQEVDTAFRLKKRILPVRLAYREPFTYPLSAWLNPLQWAFWEGADGTAKLAEELKHAVEGGDLPIGQGPDRQALVKAPPPEALRFESGAMDVGSPLYVRRAADDVAMAAIGPGGQTINIKGARQVGKSSLLMRIVDAAQKAGKQVAFVDLQNFDSETLGSADLFFRHFCSELADSLGGAGAEPVDSHWDASLSNVQRCSRYMERGVLKRSTAPVVLALDETERLLDKPFRSDFFGMLRAWHNKRALPTAPAWKKLDLVLVTSTEPGLLIKSLDQSPFNVGEKVSLGELSAAEVSWLNQQHGPALGQDEERRLLELVGGHPYLVRRALYLVASRQFGATELLSHSDLEGGPFGDHLRHLFFLLDGRTEAANRLREVLSHGTCKDPLMVDRLLGAGLVRKEGERVVPRCELYTRYFRKYLLG